jgi:hypothetical protein
LLSKSKRLELGHAEAIGNALVSSQLNPQERMMTKSTYVDDSVFQNHNAHPIDGYGALNSAGSRCSVMGVLELPAVSSFVVFQSRVVVAFVEVFQNTGEDFRLVIRQVNSLVRLIELLLAERREEWRMRQDILVGRKKPLLTANAKGDDGRSK